MRAAGGFTGPTSIGQIAVPVTDVDRAPERAGIIYYSVPDLTAAYAALLARGVEFVHPPHLIARMPDHELWMADLHDSEGNLLALMCEVRPGMAS